MKDPARVMAFTVLNEIDSSQSFSNLTLNHEFKKNKLDKRDRGFVTELVYGVIRMKKHLDYIINQFSKKPVINLDNSIRNLLRLGVYQIKFLDKVPARAAIHSTVELAKKDHHQGIIKFINGVLRAIDRGLSEVRFPDLTKDPIRHIAIVYSHPVWLVQKWVERFGVKQTIELCQYNNQVPELTIRANTLKTDIATLCDNLFEQYELDVHLLSYPDEGLLMESAGGFTELSEFQNGHFTVQGQASMLVAHALQLEVGMKVLDLCAAPGGKTTHIAALMENQGEILAVDFYPHKIELIKKNCKRLGVTNVQTLCADSTTLVLSEQYDRVLLDAPCSGLGLLREKPEIRWKKGPEDIEELVNLQSRLIKKGLSYLKTGGIMVYSTCTITQEENELAVDTILNNGDVELIDLRYLLPLTEQDIWLAQGRNQPYLEFLPHISETEGFFITAVKKLS